MLGSAFRASGFINLGSWPAAFLLLASSPTYAAPCVVLIHGLGRSPFSMASLGRGLKAKGYVVSNHSYPSTSQTIAASANVVELGVAECRLKNATPINFVTHSMGALVLRQYLQSHTLVDAGRVVMLGPPNHGSEVVDDFGRTWWFRRLVGPAGAEMTTDNNSLANRLGAPKLPVGVIAGVRSYEPWFSRAFHSPNDGKVSVESAKLAGMTDFITVRASHTFMTTSREVQDETAAFLETGRFQHR